LNHKNVLLVELTVLAAILVLPPLIFLIQSSFTAPARPGAAAVFTLDNYARVFTSSRTPALLATTLAFSLGSSLLSLVLGGTLAFLVGRTTIRWAGLAYLAMVLMLATPGIVYAIGWFLLLSPHGIVNSWAMNLGASGPLFNIHTLAGMVLVEGMNWVPLVFF